MESKINLVRQQAIALAMEIKYKANVSFPVERSKSRGWIVSAHLESAQENPAFIDEYLSRADSYLEEYKQKMVELSEELLDKYV